MKTCCWLLSQPGVFPATYCGKRVGWVMVKDDDYNVVRKYHPLCAEHTARAAALPPDADEDWGPTS